MPDVKPIPAGYHSVTPYLYLRDAAAAIEFYQKAFNAVELFRMSREDGKVGHAEIKIGNSHVMLAEEMPEMSITSPSTLNGTSIGLLIYVENVDKQFEQAVAAGGEVVRPLANQFYGDRSGTLKDPFGHTWTIATHIEDVPPEELQQRMAAMQQEGA
jgi:PhnB protein